MLKVLLIVQPERFDFYSYLSKLDDCEIDLLWYESPTQLQIAKHELPVQINKIYFWDEFLTPSGLLNKIRPDRILFFEIIDQRQIALIVAANYFSIPTFYLEHGSAGDKETAIQRSEADKTKYFFSERLPGLIKRLIAAGPHVIKVKYFYFSSFKYLKRKSKWQYFKLPFLSIMFKPNKALMMAHFPERIPFKCILFNRVNFEEFKLYTGIDEEKALMEGIPFYDDYYAECVIQGEHIIYIEQPFLEQNLLQWNKKHHQSIIEALFAFACSMKIKVYVKLHPKSDISLWQSHINQSQYFEVIQFGDFTKLYLSSKLILGYSSSLITGFLCAKKNIVLLGWHPVPTIFGVDFSKTGLCHISFSINDLDAKYSYWVNHNLTYENEDCYNGYLHRFNFPFDGKATFRVLKAIEGA